MIEFQEFQKMARLTRRVIITEKIDGTNAQIFIAPGYAGEPGAIRTWFDEATATDMVMFAGSRTRWITPEDDNAGFARWAKENATELAKLGAGRHFGEWWGLGIQRGYGLKEKRFSLFNTERWGQERPACCHVTPVLFDGIWDGSEPALAIDRLRMQGSRASPGFMKPEGIVVFHVAANIGFKKTLDKDEMSKQQAAREAATAAA
ncbi:MAG: RNA ligase family protein [Pseudomonadota bacterium]